MSEPMWHVIQPNPELRRYKVVCAVTPPMGTVSSHTEMGAALAEKGEAGEGPDVGAPTWAWRGRQERSRRLCCLWAIRLGVACAEQENGRPAQREGSRSQPPNGPARGALTGELGAAGVVVEKHRVVVELLVERGEDAVVAPHAVPKDAPILKLFAARLG